MSILQTTQSETSAILKTILHEKPSEVDWPAYVEARHQMAESQEDRLAQVLARKRAQALGYLSTRKHSLAGAYSKAESRVFTPEFVTELGQANSTRRVIRNPWLTETLQAHSNDDIELHGHANVLPFGPQIAADMSAAH